MRRTKAVALVAIATTAGLTLSACGPSGSSGGSSAYNAGNTGIVNASTHTGGTVAYQLANTPDSLDPGNTYYGFMWDFSRLYARPLLAFQSAPGKAGDKLVPDLATGLGQSSNDGKTWTYHIRSGLKFSNGEPITAQDVKYAIERSNYAPGVLSNGPTYFHSFLVDNNPAYQGPYKNRSGGLNSIQTPNDTTVVFHLSKPFADFDYLVTNPESAPVPPDKDTGAAYVQHIVSSGPYVIQSYDPSKGATLARNPYWRASTDPVSKQYADKITVAFNVAQSTIDTNLVAGDATLDLVGAGISTTSQASILESPSEKARVDDAQSNGLQYVAISEQVAPFNNIHCREAVEYAVDKASVQTAFGGDVHGDIASTILPPSVIGHTDFNLYPTPGDEGADSSAGLAAAKRQLRLCGKPNGFTTNMSARGDRPNEVAIATAIQASLAKIGIPTNIQRYPTGKYMTDYAGAPAFVHAHDLGLIVMAWQPDWPDGYGFLEEILDGTQIKASGNSNLTELNDPDVNAMLANAIANTDPTARDQAWGQTDRAAMRDAAIVPLLYRKDLLYRPASATNVFVNPAYGMYDYLTVGSTK